MQIDICRLCLKNEADKNLFDKIDTANYAEKIIACTSVNINADDRLPSKICNNCVNKLNISYEFKLQCKDSDNVLKQYLAEKSNPLIKKEKQNLDTHSIIAASVKNKKCEQSVENTLNVHEKTDEKSLHKIEKSTKQQCFICGRIMSSPFRLKMHMRIHTGLKPFTCGYCKKNFSLSQNLKVHERTHTGDKPLTCSICEKSFAQSPGLVAHMRLHTGQTPYKCNLCTSSFRTPGHLQYHIRRHTGEKKYQCTKCSKAFITRSDLTQHTKTHTGERPFVCSVCGLRMSRSSHLTRHMMTHTGEKPHRCDVCSSSYAQKGDLSRHIMKKHSIPPNSKPKIKEVNKANSAVI